MLNNMMRINKNGFSLIMSIAVILAFSILSLIAINMFSTDTQISIDSLRSSQALYLAESAMNDCIEYQLRVNGDWTINTTNRQDVPFGPGVFSIEYLDKTAKYANILFTGKVGDVTRKIRREFNKNKYWPENKEDWDWIYYLGKKLQVATDIQQGIKPLDPNIDPANPISWLFPVGKQDVPAGKQDVSDIFQEANIVLSDNSFINDSRFRKNFDGLDPNIFTKSSNNYIINGHGRNLLMANHIPYPYNFYLTGNVTVRNCLSFVSHGSIIATQNILIDTNHSISNLKNNIVIISDPTINIALAAHGRIMLQGSLNYEPNFRNTNLLTVGTIFSEGGISIGDMRCVVMYGLLYSKSTTSNISFYNIVGDNSFPCCGLRIYGSVISPLNLSFRYINVPNGPEYSVRMLRNLNVWDENICHFSTGIDSEINYAKSLYQGLMIMYKQPLGMVWYNYRFFNMGVWWEDY